MFLEQGPDCWLAAEDVSGVYRDQKSGYRSKQDISSSISIAEVGWSGEKTITGTVINVTDALHVLPTQGQCGLSVCLFEQRCGVGIVRWSGLPSGKLHRSFDCGLEFNAHEP